MISRRTALVIAGLATVSLVCWLALHPLASRTGAAITEGPEPRVAPPPPSSGSSASAASASAASGVRKRFDAAEARAARAARDRILAAIHQAQAARKNASPPPFGAAPGASAAAATPIPGIGTLDKDYVRQQMQELKPLVSQCYELALVQHPELEGRLQVRFSIVAEPEVGGVIEEVELDPESPLAGDPILGECVRETMYALELKAPTGGGRVQVSYPFQFRPAAPP